MQAPCSLLQQRLHSQVLAARAPVRAGDLVPAPAGMPRLRRLPAAVGVGGTAIGVPVTGFCPSGVGLLALAATPSHTTSTVPAAPVQTQPAPPVNVTINNTPASSSVATQDYFYCPAQKGYYPTIPSCPTGWIKITPQG